jgi:hypothetical protein
LLWIADDFLLPPAKEAFRAQALDSWPVAVHWFLSALEAAVRQMQVNGQSKADFVRQYGHLLQLQAAALCSLMSSSEVKSLFAQGLLDPVRSLFAANQPNNELEEYTPLSVLVNRAELLETEKRLILPVPTRFGSRLQSHSPNILVTPAEQEAVYRDSQS